MSNEAISAADLAKYLLRERGPMSTMKLQKLVFYCQAYSLAWVGERIFHEPVRAWTNGPVVYELYRQHRGSFEVDVDDISGDDGLLSDRDKVVADSILESLGSLTGWELRNRTHEEDPWDDAFDPSDSWHNTEITTEAMERYYAATR